MKIKMQDLIKNVFDSAIPDKNSVYSKVRRKILELDKRENFWLQKKTFRLALLSLAAIFFLSVSIIMLMDSGYFIKMANSNDQTVIQDDAINIRSSKEISTNDNEDSVNKYTDNNGGKVPIYENNEKTTKPRDAEDIKNSNNSSNIASRDQECETPVCTVVQENTIIGENSKKVLPWEVGTWENAKAIMGNSLFLPSYIPEDFELKKIEIPKNKFDKSVGVRITYEDKASNFFILSIRNFTSSGTSPANSETTYITDNKGYLVWSKSEDSSRFNINLKWEYNKLEYGIISEGIEKHIVTKIAESIK